MLYKFRNYRHFTISVALALVAAISFTSCGDDDYPPGKERKLFVLNGTQYYTRDNVGDTDDEFDAILIYRYEGKEKDFASAVTQCLTTNSSSIKVPPEASYALSVFQKVDFPTPAILWPKKVTALAASSFNGCTTLTQVTLPKDLVAIYGNGALFSESRALTDIYCCCETPPAFVNGASLGVNTATVTLHVLQGQMAAWKAAAPWSAFANIVDDATPQPEFPEFEPLPEE